MSACYICLQTDHSAMYCPKAIDERKIRRRLKDIVRDTKPFMPVETLPDGTRVPMRIPIPEVRRVMDEERLEVVVARQVGELTRDLDGWHGVAEMPAPPRDLTSYADARASAVKKCRHEDVNNISYGRQWLCTDCGKYLDRKAMREARGDIYWWSW